MGHELILLGLAFLLAGLLARAGRRVGLPTIPFFIGAGILVGPNTAGPVLFERPEDLGQCVLASCCCHPPLALPEFPTTAIVPPSASSDQSFSSAPSQGNQVRHDLRPPQVSHSSVL